MWSDVLRAVSSEMAVLSDLLQHVVCVHGVTLQETVILTDLSGTWESSVVQLIESGSGLDSLLRTCLVDIAKSRSFPLSSSIPGKMAAPLQLKMACGYTCLMTHVFTT
jgi:hypothetical protein